MPLLCLMCILCPSASAGLVDTRLHIVTLSRFYPFPPVRIPVPMQILGLKEIGEERGRDFIPIIHYPVPITHQTSHTRQPWCKIFPHDHF